MRFFKDEMMHSFLIRRCHLLTTWLQHNKQNASFSQHHSGKSGKPHFSSPRHQIAQKGIKRTIVLSLSFTKRQNKKNSKIDENPNNTLVPTKIVLCFHFPWWRSDRDWDWKFCFIVNKSYCAMMSEETMACIGRRSNAYTLNLVILIKPSLHGFW